MKFTKNSVIGIISCVIVFSCILFGTEHKSTPEQKQSDYDQYIYNKAVELQQTERQKQEQESIDRAILLKKMELDRR